MKQTLYAWLRTLFSQGPQQNRDPQNPDLTNALPPDLTGVEGVTSTPQTSEPKPAPSPEVLSWEKSLVNFNPKTDLLIIPEESEDFVEKSLESDIVIDALTEATEAGVLITIKDLPRPAVVRSGMTKLF